MMFRQAVRPSLRRIVLFVVCVVILCENANAIFDYPPPNESAPDEGITCQRLGMLNQTKILCHTRTKVENLDKIRKSQEKTKDGRVCTKIFNLVQRLQTVEEGNFRYCDPSRCLLESRHCRGGEMTPECNLCLGKCWIQYSYPQDTVQGLQYRSFPCDPTVCGKEVLCGGWDAKNGKKNHFMNHNKAAK